MTNTSNNRQDSHDLHYDSHHNSHNNISSEDRKKYEEAVRKKAESFEVKVASFKEVKKSEDHENMIKVIFTDDKSKDHTYSVFLGDGGKLAVLIDAHYTVARIYEEPQQDRGRQQNRD